MKFLPKAYRDIEEIYNYISQTLIEKDIALKIVNDIEEAIFGLEKFPLRGAERKIGMYADKGYRQVFCKNFNIIYRVDELMKYVIIVTIRYSKSNF